MSTLYTRTVFRVPVKQGCVFACTHGKSRDTMYCRYLTYPYYYTTGHFVYPYGYFMYPYSTLRIRAARVRFGVHARQGCRPGYAGSKDTVL